MGTDAAKTRWRRLLSPARILAYLGLYLVLFTIGCAISLTDRLLMIPSTQPVKLNDVERVTLDAGRSRAVDLYRRRTPTTRPAAYALEFIGNGDRAEWIASLALTDFDGQPVEAYAMNYPGYGGSTGPARLKTSAEAGLIAYDWLRARAGDRPIFLTGRSLGTTVALHVAASRPDVAGLVLTNPPPLRQLIRSPRFGWWNLWLLSVPVSWGVPGELDSLANARRVRAPAVFFTAGRDELVPPAYQRKVIDAYAGEHRVVTQQSAGHNDEASGPDAARLADELRWLWRRAVVDNPTGPLD